MRDLLRILGSARQLWRYYGIIGACTVLLAFMNLLQPLFAGWGINEIRRGSDANVHYLVWLAVGIFVADVAANLLSNIGGYFGDQMALKLNRYLSSCYYQKLLALPQPYFDRELTGKIINRLNRSINQITSFFQMLSNNFLQFLFTSIFTLIIVAHYSWPVAVMMLVLYPFYGFLTARSTAPWRVYQGVKNHHFDLASGRFSEVVNQMKVVRSYLQERAELNYFDGHYQKAQAINAPQSRYWHRQDVYRRLAINVVFFAVYLFIFMQGAAGNITPGVAVALILYGMQIRTPIFTISVIIDNAQRALADSRDYFEIMDIDATRHDPPDAQTLLVERGGIVFRGVNFGYDPEQLVLKDIDLRIRPRSTVALVGESGEGKTTLTNLLLRMYEPTSGQILIDGQDIAAVSLASLREQIGVVFQEPALFSGTIRDNIAYARPLASEDEVVAAAKAANAFEFIDRLDDGLDTAIGERGVRLSGGQRQRIAIARAVLKNAPILILDEATSSLDSRSEVLVHEALERLMAGRTTIIIAHRLSTISHADMIVTVKKGRIDEVGSPAKLAASGGIYAQLLLLQDRHTAATDRRLKAFGIQEQYG